MALISVRADGADLPASIMRCVTTSTGTYMSCDESTAKNPATPLLTAATLAPSKPAATAADRTCGFVPSSAQIYDVTRWNSACKYWDYTPVEAMDAAAAQMERMVSRSDPSLACCRVLMSVSG
eukprot:CAMPEP_0183343016 /NCGR_PEP_ID=MMETSP0164_2-20130417/9015_1 /TAXON_ID=221442 /ORGANISM="Coccolithus pelagicus ssp braarudi, Strain PLY182g" /LENGTH=122 /DNA_ID=CAMNT_0025513755 /DNA_START=381 /DNA_END=749 /DNA_ORIENTATION=-